MEKGSVDERVLPHALDAERAVLGAVLLSPAAWPVAASRLVAEHFYREAHRRIFAALGRLAERGVPADFLTLKDELTRAGELEACGGPAYLASLTDGMPVGAHVEAHADIVREKARLRDLIATAHQIIASAYDAEERAAAIAASAASSLFGPLSDGTGVVKIDDVVHTYATALSAGSLGDLVETGYADVDRLIGGLRPASFSVLAARPSVGKSSWALKAAESMARRTGKPVIFFTLEMSLDGIVGRLVAWRASVSAHRSERGQATQEEYRRVAEALCAFTDLPLYLEATATSVVEIEAWCRRVRHDRDGLAAVVVDYLQLIVPGRRHQSSEAEIAEISRSLKRLAKDLHAPVLALSQLNRAPESRPDKRPHPSDLRGSGALEQDTDLVILLHRPEMYGRTPENKGVAEVVIAKNRDGPTGMVKLRFDAELARFTDVEWRHSEERECETS